VDFCLRKGSLWNKDAMVMEIKATNGAEMPNFDPNKSNFALVGLDEPAS